MNQNGLLMNHWYCVHARAGEYGSTYGRANNPHEHKAGQFKKALRKLLQNRYQDKGKPTPVVNGEPIYAGNEVYDKMKKKLEEFEPSVFNADQMSKFLEDIRKKEEENPFYTTWWNGSDKFEPMLAWEHQGNASKKDEYAKKAMAALNELDNALKGKSWVSRMTRMTPWYQ